MASTRTNWLKDGHKPIFLVLVTNEKLWIAHHQQWPQQTAAHILGQVNTKGERLCLGVHNNITVHNQYCNTSNTSNRFKYRGSNESNVFLILWHGKKNMTQHVITVTETLNKVCSFVKIVNMDYYDDIDANHLQLGSNTEIKLTLHIHFLFYVIYISN